MGYGPGVDEERRPIRWVEEAEDPEFEAQLVRELERRRRARREERERRRRERRSRLAFWLLVLVGVAVVAALGYGARELARSAFGV
jgi:cell division septal protein FtsQ